MYRAGTLYTPRNSLISLCQWVTPDEWGPFIVYPIEEVFFCLQNGAKAACKTEFLNLRHRLKKTGFHNLGRLRAGYDLSNNKKESLISLIVG